MLGYSLSGSTNKFFAYNSANYVWNSGVPAYEAWVDAHYVLYQLNAVEQGSSSRFVGTEPANAVRYNLRKILTNTPSGDPVVWEDNLSLPAAQPNSNGGLLTFGTSVGQINPDGSGHVPVSDVVGKVLGAGGGTITGVGAWGLDSSGNALATSSQATSILNAVNAITNITARGKASIPSIMARPTSGSSVYEIDLNLYSLQGTAEDGDSNAIIIHARNSSGGSLDGGLSATTMTRTAAGKYKVNYTVVSTDTAGEVFFDFSWTVSGTAFILSDVTMVEDADSLSTLLAIKAKTDNLPASPAAVGSAMALTSAALDAILIESGITPSASLTNDAGTQLTGINARQAIAAILSAIAGVLSGAPTGPILVKPAGVPAGNTRLRVSPDSANNRTAIVVKVPT